MKRLRDLNVAPGDSGSGDEKDDLSEGESTPRQGSKKRGYVKRATCRKKRVCIRRREWNPTGMLAERMMVVSKGEIEARKRVTWDLNIATEITDPAAGVSSQGMAREEDEDRKKKQKKSKIYHGFWSKKLGLSDDDLDCSGDSGDLEVEAAPKTSCLFSMCFNGSVAGQTKPRGI